MPRETLRLLAPFRPDPIALTLLALAALCVLVAGFQHARLFHRGYAEVEIVGDVTDRVGRALRNAGSGGADQAAGCAACGACSPLSAVGG
jgi:hypothetical protein